MERITVAAGNTVYHASGNCLIKTATKTLILGCKNSIIPTDGSVTIIGERAFYRCRGLTFIDIPEGVTKIAANAFNDCTALAKIVFPTTLKTVEDGAFAADRELVYLYLKGTPDQWNNVLSIGSGNEWLRSTIRYYYSEDLPSDLSGRWHYVNGIPTLW